MTDDSLDLLRGAGPIAKFLFGSDDKPCQRRVYHLTEFERIPVFKLGSVLCARRSTLIKWIEDQERRAMGRAA